MKSIAILTPNATTTGVAHGGARSKDLTLNVPPTKQTANTDALPSNMSQQSHNNANNNSNTNSEQNTQQVEAFMRMFSEFRNLLTNNNENNAARPRAGKIHKWNVKFNGDKQADVFEFLRTIKSKAQANHVCDAELLNSAGEFFSGFAAKWFYSQTFRNWTELSEKLVSDFVQVNYFDELIDIIRQRRQSPNETIVHFFTVFEDDCSRLKDPLPQAEKIKIIKKNVLQKYRPYIALANFHSLNEIKEALKILEATMPQSSYQDSNRFKRYNSGDRLSNSPDNRTNNTHESRMDKFNNDKQVGFSRDRSQSNNSFRSISSRNNSRENRQRTNSNGSYYRENSQNRASNSNQSFRNSSGSRAENKQETKTNFP